METIPATQNVGGGELWSSASRAVADARRRYELARRVPGEDEQGCSQQVARDYPGEWCRRRSGRSGSGEGTLLTDGYDLRHRLLIEAKATADRPSLRMALGQLLDYQR